MRCIASLKIRGPKNTWNVVPCGKCNNCLATKRDEWTFRLVQENKVSTSAYFLTLTYDDDKLPTGSNRLPQLCKQDVVDFTKRLRSVQVRELPGSPGIRYYTVGEYGTQTKRPHYHSIMFNLQREMLPKLPGIWGKGLTHYGQVSQASIHYVTKYVINKAEEPVVCPALAICQSREPP